MQNPVVLGASCSLVHVPDLVRYGSKPTREIGSGPGLDALAAHLRSYQDAVAYGPNQAFIGNIDPDQLHEVPTPWYENLLRTLSPIGPFGRIASQEQFYAVMKATDQFDLVWLEEGFSAEIQKDLDPEVCPEESRKKIGAGLPMSQIQQKVESRVALPLYSGERLIGCLQRGHEQDEALTAMVLMENLTVKASAVIALRDLLRIHSLEPDSIDYIMSCSEEAVGDRYNRGGGALAKAIGEDCGCTRATGADVKAFCCGPIHSMIMATSLVAAGIFENVVVVGGGSLPKLGMKFQSHVEKNMPVLEDVLGCFAILVGRDDGKSPIIRLDGIGRHDVATGSAQQAIMQALVIKPLDKLGLRIVDVDKYSTELHNPEITLPSDRGDVPRTNYRTIGALAAGRKEIVPSELESFVRKHGMPGYAPTQGHVPSAVPYLPFARDAIMAGRMTRAMFLGKGSLFLGRMTNLSDGASFILETNPNGNKS
ncbi:MAG: glycine reductase [Chloroflexi bacterium]|nr:glycine reductase [Chloroflexota bacterium]